MFFLIHSMLSSNLPEMSVSLSRGEDAPYSWSWQGCQGCHDVHEQQHCCCLSQMLAEDFQILCPLQVWNQIIHSFFMCWQLFFGIVSSHDEWRGSSIKHARVDLSLRLSMNHGESAYVQRTVLWRHNGGCQSRNRNYRTCVRPPWKRIFLAEKCRYVRWYVFT